MQTVQTAQGESVRCLTVFTNDVVQNWTRAQETGTQRQECIIIVYYIYIYIYYLSTK